ncbi:MAG: AAA family ATPase [Myxococcota bacterium]
MYTAFYGLREKPFALVPDPRYLFLAASHREGLAHLLYGIDQSEGFISVTGEVGTGKTTICRTLLERLGAETEVAFLFNPSRSGIELLQDISAEFGLESGGLSRSELGAQLNRFLLRKKQEKRRVLLIIDEAQNLSESTLEQVRLLSNLETASQKLIQILLLGQPELDRKLDSPELRQLRQRISVRWGLNPLTAKETREYVRHRVHVAAGAERNLFSAGALRAIYKRTQGVPRLVNVLCDRVLLAGYVARAPQISAAIVKQAARDIPDAQRRPLFARRGPRVRGAARSAARSLGSGAIFGVGLALGLAVTGGLLVGLTEFVRERPQPLLASGADGEIEVAALPAPAVSSPPPSVTVAIGNPQLRSFAPEVVDRGVGAGDYLDAILAAEDEDVTRRAAVNAIVAAFGLRELDAAPRTDALALIELGERGLDSLELSDANFETLRALDHPALMRVRGLDESETRLVALLGVDGDLALIHGVIAAGPLWIPVDELVQQWDGEAWVVWSDFESIRPILAFGEQGHAVIWLQEALAQLGYYDSTVTGLFDRATREGLQSFQRSQALEADGMAGPLTRMALYGSLEQYSVPQLSEAREDDG